MAWLQRADQIGTAMLQPGKVPTIISCRPKRGSKAQSRHFARREQGQYFVQTASFTVNKWSNLGRSHSVTFGVSLCSKTMESFFLILQSFLFYSPYSRSYTGVLFQYMSQCVAMSRKMMESDIVATIWRAQYQSTVLFQLFSSENGLRGQNLRLFS